MQIFKHVARVYLYIVFILKLYMYLCICTHYGRQISHRKVNEEMFVAPKLNYILQRRVY